jgi:hypothetical protein
MQNQNVSVWKDIGQSWLALKPWVKVWLWVLNAVFIAALVLPHSSLRTWIVLSYVGAGLCLLPIMIIQRGLTRLLGLGHLLPWTPLLIYLALRLCGDAAGPRIHFSDDPWIFGYVSVLISAVIVCLVFDVYDAYRWIRGERYVMGSKEAAERGASRLSTRYRQRV